jgi:hypothetical protein
VAPAVSDVRFWVDSVAKVENRTAPKISRKSILADSIAVRLHSADTRVGGRFLLK